MNSIQKICPNCKAVNIVRDYKKLQECSSCGKTFDVDAVKSAKTTTKRKDMKDFIDSVNKTTLVANIMPIIDKSTFSKKQKNNASKIYTEPQSIFPAKIVAKSPKQEDTEVDNEKYLNEFFEKLKKLGVKKLEIDVNTKEIKPIN